MKPVRSKVWLIALAIGLAASLARGAGTVVDVTTFGARADSGEDATAPFLRAIAALRTTSGPKTLVIPKGRYDFFSPHATRRACYLSNATEPGSDAVRTIAIDLTDLDDLTISGESATLVMRGRMTMLVAERCRNLAIRGLTFDFARPTVSEITAVERGDGYWIGRVQRDSSYRIVDRRIEWFGEDWCELHNLVQHFDPVTSKVWRGSDPTAGATSVRDLGERFVQFDVPADSLRDIVVGRTYQFRETTRDQTGMWFDRCRNVSMHDVAIRAMAGFGVLFQSTETVDLDRIDVAPTKASGRTCVAAADILHFSGCRGRIRVRDSVLTAAHDDAINIHGTHLRVIATPGSRQIRVRFMHPQTWGFAAYVPGDEIEFVRKDTLLPYARAKVVALEMADDRHEQILTLDRDLPKGLELDSDAIENVTWTPSVEISGCEIARVPTRGILVTTRRPVRILGNRFFRTPMSAILLEDDAAGWYESGAVHDLLIRGNAFFECGDAPIAIHPQNAVHSGPVHRNVRIESNRFTLAGEFAVSVRSTDGVTIFGNRFDVADGADRSVSALVRALNATGVRFRNNVVKRRP